MIFVPLPYIRLVLVEPAGALNVGSVARVMANMGLSQLVLVQPHCDPLGEEARRMAVHAAYVLERAQIVNDLPEALAGCVRAIATTARPRAIDIPLEPPEVALPWLLRQSKADAMTDAPTTSADNAMAALIFGPEDRGLSNEELNQAQRFVCIPSNPAYPSLNLAQAVAVCCYELARATRLEMQPFTPQSKPSTRPLAAIPLKPVSLEQLEGFHRHLETLLLKIEYLYPHTASSRMEKFRRFFLKAAPTQQELAMLRGILRQVEWALAQTSDNGSGNGDLLSAEDD